MRPNRSQGFTLIELMITVTVLVLLTTTALPAMFDLFQRNRISAQTNELLAAINLTRSEAVRRGEAVAICRRVPRVGSATCIQFGTGCQCSTDANEGWEQGWLVFVDDGATQNFFEAGEELIAVQDEFSGGTTVNGNGFVNRRLRYDPRGGITSGAGTLKICPPGTETTADSDRIQMSRRIRVSVTGRAAVVKGEAAKSGESSTGC